MSQDKVRLRVRQGRVNAPSLVPSQWGVPDWRDKAFYPNSNNRQRWAWEFLRRSHDYRRFFQERVLPHVDPVTKQFEHKREIAGYCANLTANPESSYWESAIVVARDRFGLDQLGDPRESSLMPRFQSQALVMQLTYEDDLGRTVVMDEGMRPSGLAKPTPGSLKLKSVSPRIDVRFPLQPQFRHAERLSKLLIDSHEPRFRLRLFPTYLRILDAGDAKAADVEIAQVLCPRTEDGEQTVRNHRRAALRLVSGEYLRLAATAD